MQANAALPLSGEYLAKAPVVAAAQERVRVASLARYGIELASEVQQMKESGESYGAFLTPSSGADALSAYRPSLASNMPTVVPRSAATADMKPDTNAGERTLVLPGGGTMQARAQRVPKKAQHVVIIRHVSPNTILANRRSRNKSGRW